MRSLVIATASTDKADTEAMSHKVERLPKLPARTPPRKEPTGMVPMTKNFMVPVIRARRRLGVMARRKLTWLTP